MITIFNIRPKALNVGNDVIFVGMEHFLQKAFGEMVNIVSMPATSKYEAHFISGLTARTIYEINQYGHGVIIGGGNLYENGELEVNLNALNALEVPLMLFSLSRGRIYNRKLDLTDRTDVMPDEIIKALNKKAVLSLSRDKATDKYLNSIGCLESKCGGCPSLFLDYLKDKLPDFSSQYGSTVFIALRNPNLMSIPLSAQRTLQNDISEIVSFFRDKNNLDVKLLCHDYRDISYAASFEDIEYVYTDNAYNFLGILKSAMLTVTFRLHCFLPCLAFGTPSVNISYDERALSLIDTIGLADWNINLFDGNNLFQEVKKRYEKIDTMPVHVNDAKDNWRNLYDIMQTAFDEFAEYARQHQIS